MTRRRAASGSALVVALVVTVGLSLLGLVLMLTSVELARTGGDPLRLRTHAALTGALDLVASNAATPAGAARLRRLATPRSEEVGPERAEERKRDAARHRDLPLSALPGVSLAPPLFSAAFADDGTDLVVRSQETFATEVFRVAAVSGAPGEGAAPRLAADLCVGAAPVDVSRLPEPAPR